MGLDQCQVVDAISIHRESGAVHLTIADSWDWDDEAAHLQALQEKINAYLGFIQSGEIFAAYPNAVGRRLCIEILTRLPIPDSALWFLDEAANVASKLSVAVRSRHVP